MVINPTNGTWLLVCSLIKGVGSATLTGTIFAMVADTIEYGEWKTGTRVKVCCIRPQPSAQKWEADLRAPLHCGLSQQQAMTDLPQPRPQVHFLQSKPVSVVPIPFYAIMILFYVFYKLDKIYPQVMEELKAREAAKEKY